MRGDRTPDNRIQVRHDTSRLSPWLQIHGQYSIKYVTLNTTYAFKRSAMFLSGGLPVFINGYGVPFWSYYMLVLPHLHKQLLFAAGKDPALPFTNIWSMIGMEVILSHRILKKKSHCILSTEYLCIEITHLNFLPLDINLYIFHFLYFSM